MKPGPFLSQAFRPWLLTMDPLINPGLLHVSFVMNEVALELGFLHVSSGFPY
jgi:hypothetical protein